MLDKSRFLIIGKRRLQSVLLVLAVSACSTAEPKKDQDALIADGARDVSRYQLEHPDVTQVSYNVDIQYPGSAISPEKISFLKQRGWRQCAEYKGEWEHFRDSTMTPMKLVHQNLTSFAKDGEYMVVTMRYISALPSSDESKPDNSIQRVVILHYDLSTKEVQEQMAKSIAECSR